MAVLRQTQVPCHEPKRARREKKIKKTNQNLMEYPSGVPGCEHCDDPYQEIEWLRGEVRFYKVIAGCFGLALIGLLLY